MAATCPHRFMQPAAVLGRCGAVAAPPSAVLLPLAPRSARPLQPCCAGGQVPDDRRGGGLSPSFFAFVNTQQQAAVQRAAPDPAAHHPPATPHTAAPPLPPLHHLDVQGVDSPGGSTWQPAQQHSPPPDVLPALTYHSDALLSPEPHPQPAQNVNGGQQDVDASLASPSLAADDSAHPTNATSNGQPASATPSPDQAVADALARAQAAMVHAETSLANVEELPSAREPGRWAGLLHTARTAALMLGFPIAMVAAHAMGLWFQLASSCVGALTIAWWGYTRSALSASGAAAAFLVGWGTIGTSLRFGATLLAFFFTSSKLTRFKEEIKTGLDDEGKAGGQRDWKQVLCNGGVPTLLALGYGILVGCVDVPLGPSPHSEPWRAQLASLLEGAFLGYYACCCGDTWASELGPLSPASPRLITTLRPVRKGTNGGVTLAGLAASAAGGVFMGLVFYAAALASPTLLVLEGQQAAALRQWWLIPLGLAAGLLGSLLDSLLGATLQFSGFNAATGRVTGRPGPGVAHIAGLPVLDNNAVNILSASTISGLTALAALLLSSLG